MNKIHAKYRVLALKADRKILTANEESYIRLDLLAHEKAIADILLIRKPFFSFLPFAGIKHFAITALILYGILFALTNASAYSKIALSSIKDAFNKPEIASISNQNQINDPWQESKISSSVKTAPLAVFETNLTDQKDYVPALSLVPTSYDNRIKIPGLKIDAPIVEPLLGINAIESNDWVGLEEQIRETLLQGVVHYPGTANPGQKGNAFFTGHSSNVFWELSEFNTVFALLPKIKIGDDIVLTYNQNEYHYRVIGKKEVYPTDVSSLEQGDDYKLTLVTCTPVGTAFRRLIVTAELIKD
ncbi:MAG: sortase [Candidatus Gracilibacteria bacterium]